MAFGQKITMLRKEKKIRQTDLGRSVGTSGDIIGKYERGETLPSIEMAAKIADCLGVTLDYLVKDGEYEQIDKVTLSRLKEIEKLPQELKEKIYFFIDVAVRDFKTGQAYS
jgi:transcriptional regulator with XRE-family HTH domain